MPLPDLRPIQAWELLNVEIALTLVLLYFLRHHP